jgi:DNA polymerase V
MEAERFHPSAYKGTKTFTQQDVQTVNARGFGAAADDYAERGIDLNEQLIRNKPATFFFKMNGDAMQRAGIFDRDVLVVDRSIKPQNGKVVIAAYNGDLLVRRLKTNTPAAPPLLPENDRFKPLQIDEYSQFEVWGVVTYVIHAL